MKHSESIGKLTAALVAAQAELEHAHKQSVNPHFKNRYADLTEVVDTVRPILNKHGLAYTQLLGYEAGVTLVETVLVHGASGEWISGTAGARVQKDDPQGVGSATTYLRRYSLAALCGIGQEDDDAEGSVEHRAPTPEQRRFYEKPSDPVGVKHSNVPDFLDTVARGARAKGKTWRELLKDEDGRGYVTWAIKHMTTLDFAQREALQAAINADLDIGNPDFSKEMGTPLPAEVAGK